MSGLVLIVEDEKDAAEILEAYLKKDGFDVVVADDGEKGLQLFRQAKPDLVLLDMMLPRVNGTEVLSQIRKASETPVIMVTAIGDEPDKLGALRYGADDYVVKPCNPKEIVARVHAVLRRTKGARKPDNLLRFENLWVDQEAISAAVDTPSGPEHLDLTRSEFLILAALLRTPHKAFTREELLELCMPDSEALARVIDTHIHNLRRKLEALGISGVLVTVRSVGYKFK
ncbi:response regulator transcription factor [Metapseudomonas otitidis]